MRLGQFYWRKGSHAAAASELERAVQMAQELDLPNLEGIAYRSLAANAWRQGDIAGAQRHGERSAVLHRQTNDVRNLFRSHYFLAIVAQNQQQLTTARAYLEPILQAAPELGDRPLETGAVSLLAQIASYEGQFEQALAYLKRERQLAEESGRQWQLGSNLSNLGDVWLRLGNFIEAEACYTTALALFRQLETRQAQSNVLAYMGLAAYLQGDYGNGRARCEEALHLARQEKALREEAFALTFLAHNLCGQQEWLAACASYEAAMVVWQQLNDASRQMEAQAGLARARLENEEQAAAAATIAPVLDFVKEHSLNGANDPAQVYLNCFAVLTAVNDQQADAVLQRGQALLAKRAGQIADPHLRQQFLTAIPSHRALRAYAD